MGVIGSPFGPPVVAPIGSPFRHPAQDSFRKLLSLYRILSDGRIDLQGWTDSRAADILVKDHEGVYRTIPGGVVAVEGARVVRNLNPQDSEDITSGYGYNTEITINGASSFSFAGNGVFGSIDVPISTKDGIYYVSRYKIKNTGNSSCRIYIRISNSASGSVVPTYYILSPGEEILFSGEFLGRAGGGNIYFGVYIPADQPATTFEWTQIQVEEKSSPPSEYVRTGTGYSGLAYYVTQNGNTVDPVTGIVTEAKGADLPGPFYAVHEPASTNQLEYSTEIENWSSNTRVIIEITDDFLGEFRARKIIPTTEDNSHSSGNYEPIDNLGYYTFWCIAEAAGETVFIINVYDSVFGTHAQCTFDLSAKTVTPDGNNASGGIEELKPGIFYCWYTVEATATGTNYSSIVPRTTGAYAGDGVSGIKVYHCQMEHLAFPTSPIITDGAAASRDACTSEIPKAGHFNDDEGMLIYDVVYDIDSATAASDDYGVTLFGDYEFVLYTINKKETHYTYDKDSVSGVHLDWAAGDLLHFYVRWNKNKKEKQIGVSINGGAWVHGSVSTYDGDFKGQPILRLGHTIQRNFKVKQLHVYNKDKGRDWIEANY